jgi:hypothetical protein
VEKSRQGPEGLAMILWKAPLWLGLLLALSASAEKPTFSLKNYHRIQDGMALAAVERFLGPGTEVTLDEIPFVHGKAPMELERAVVGDHFYRWWKDPSRPHGTSYILIGVKEGKVVKKFYFSYSL